MGCQWVCDGSLVPACSSGRRLLCSGKRITGGALQTAKSIKSTGKRAYQIIGYIALKVGEFNNVKFGIKDLNYNLSKINFDNTGNTDVGKA